MTAVIDRSEMTYDRLHTVFSLPFLDANWRVMEAVTSIL